LVDEKFVCGKDLSFENILFPGGVLVKPFVFAFAFKAFEEPNVLVGELAKPFVLGLGFND
jgi:hypothetical protein